MVNRSKAAVSSPYYKDISSFWGLFWWSERHWCIFVPQEITRKCKVISNHDSKISDVTLMR